MDFVERCEDIKIKYSYFKSEIMLLFDDKSESEN